MSHFNNQLPAPTARAQALRQSAQLPHLQPRSAASSAFSNTWVPLGPQPVLSYPYGDISGRVTAIALNPFDSQDVWIGAADGGVWHSIDGGGHWATVSDTWPTLSIGAIAIDPTNGHTIYVGTGEANLNADAYWGLGVFKSTDDGATWTQLGLSAFGGLGISKIAVDPNNSSNILVAVAYNGFHPPSGWGGTCYHDGIWRSTDGGTTWTQVLADVPGGICNGDFGNDVLFDPTHPGVAFAGLGNGEATALGFASQAGVYKSTDSGATWTQLTTGLPTGNAIERVSLGISHDGQHLYAAMTDGGLV